tara:strand:- start:1339 stop:1722 length:384 start_codon:yes stop_codon:yes gene_type:complete
MAARRKRKPTLNQFIINKFLLDPKAIWKNKGLAAREMKVTKTLIEKYPLEFFWKALPLKFAMESLVWFISPQGLAYLKLEFAKFSLDLPSRVRYDVSDIKLGEDKKISLNTKTLKDFIKYGSKKENS